MIYLTPKRGLTAVDREKGSKTQQPESKATQSVADKVDG